MAFPHAGEAPILGIPGANRGPRRGPTPMLDLGGASRGVGGFGSRPAAPDPSHGLALYASDGPALDLGNGISSTATEAEMAAVELSETSVYLNGMRIPSHGVAGIREPESSSVHQQHDSDLSPSGVGSTVTFSAGTLGDAAAAAAAARRRGSDGPGRAGEDLRRTAQRRAGQQQLEEATVSGSGAFGRSAGGELSDALQSAIAEVESSEEHARRRQADAAAAIALGVWHDSDMHGAPAPATHEQDEIHHEGWMDPSASQTQGLSRTAILRKVRDPGLTDAHLDTSSAAAAASASASASGKRGDRVRRAGHLHKVDFRRESLRVKPLGAGASGTVTMVVHVPTLTLLAAKTVPVTDAEKRHNVGMEFTLLYETMASFADHVGTKANLLREELALANLQKQVGNVMADKDEDGDDASTVTTGRTPIGANITGVSMASASSSSIGVSAASPVAPVPADGGACPYLVSFYDAFSDAAAGTVTFVMEYMNAGTLEQFVDTGGIPNESMLSWICWQCLQGLQWMHRRGVLHRDIKPANILVSTAGDIKLSDLGISKRLPQEEAMARTMVGTFSHMSPERADEKPYDAKSDVWSLGLVMLSVAEGAGANPFEGKTFFEVLSLVQLDPPQLRADKGWSAEFRDFVRLCLMKDPAERASVDELLSHAWMEGVGERVLQRKADRLRAWLASADESSGRSAGAEVSDLARSELHELVEKVQKYRFRAAMTKNLPAMPRIRPSRMRWLARQLDLPPRLVSRAFRRTQDKINAKLEQISRRRHKQKEAAARLAAATEAASSSHRHHHSERTEQHQMHDSSLDAFQYGAPPARGSAKHHAATEAPHSGSDAGSFASTSSPDVSPPPRRTRDHHYPPHDAPVRGRDEWEGADQSTTGPSSHHAGLTPSVTASHHDHHHISGVGGGHGVGQAAGSHAASPPQLQVPASHHHRSSRRGGTPVLIDPAGRLAPAHAASREGSSRRRVVDMPPSRTRPHHGGARPVGMDMEALSASPDIATGHRRIRHAPVPASRLRDSPAAVGTRNGLPVVPSLHASPSPGETGQPRHDFGGMQQRFGRMKGSHATRLRGPE